MKQCLTVRSFIGSHSADWEDAQMFQHDSVEITAILDGSGFFRWNQGRCLVESGQVVLIPCRLWHSFHASSPIRFGVLLIDDLPPSLDDLFARLTVPNEPQIITLSTIDRDIYKQLFHQWLRVAFETLKEPQLNQEAWIRVLLLFLFEHSHSSEVRLSIPQVADFLRTNLNTAVTVAQLASDAGLSAEGLRNQFRKSYGITPKQFQQLSRLTEAKWLISSAERDMASIASELGFSQIHSFSTWFKKMEGVSPSFWRKAQRAQHE